MAKRKPTHGGARKGAGRPPSDDPKKMVSIRLSSEQERKIIQASQLDGEKKLTWMQRKLEEAADKRLARS